MKGSLMEFLEGVGLEFKNVSSILLKRCTGISLHEYKTFDTISLGEDPMPPLLGGVVVQRLRRDSDAFQCVCSCSCGESRRQYVQNASVQTPV